MINILKRYGCISLSVENTDLHSYYDEYGKENEVTITYSPWHPNPSYRIFKTGTLGSRNEEYPSGLIIVDEKGIPHVWKK